MEEEKIRMEVYEELERKEREEDEQRFFEQKEEEKKTASTILMKENHKKMQEERIRKQRKQQLMQEELKKRSRSKTFKAKPKERKDISNEFQDLSYLKVVPRRVDCWLDTDKLNSS